MQNELTIELRKRRKERIKGLRRMYRKLEQTDYRESNQAIRAALRAPSAYAAIRATAEVQS